MNRKTLNIVYFCAINVLAAIFITIVGVANTSYADTPEVPQDKICVATGESDISFFKKECKPGELVLLRNHAGAAGSIMNIVAYACDTNYPITHDQNYALCVYTDLRWSIYEALFKKAKAKHFGYGR